LSIFHDVIWKKCLFLGGTTKNCGNLTDLPFLSLNKQQENPFQQCVLYLFTRMYTQETNNAISVYINGIILILRYPKLPILCIFAQQTPPLGGSTLTKFSKCAQNTTKMPWNGIFLSHIWFSGVTNPLSTLFCQ
jgi:hypothetical protein